MPSERDPRKDPKPGDVLFGNNGGRKERRTVTAVAVKMVMYTKRADGYMESMRPLRSWQSWAKDAEVIHRAD